MADILNWKQNSVASFEKFIEDKIETLDWNLKK